MNESVKKIINDACDISNLHGQISALYKMKSEITEKIIILHKLINELKSTVRGLEEELEKIGIKNGK